MAPSAIDPQATSTSSLAKENMINNLAATVKSIAPPKMAPSKQPLLAELDASKLTFTPTTTPKPVPTHDKTTDYMITCSWTADEGWAAPAMVPYGPLPLMPTASCLHYATECFEGLKLYRGPDNRLRLFRPDLNAKRMLLSSLRCTLPGFRPEELVKLIMALAARDGAKFLPPVDANASEEERAKGGFLYIRPTAIGTDSDLGMKKPRTALLFIVMNYFPRLDEMIASRSVHPGMNLLASRQDEIRAWPGGFGHAKLGANYGPSLVALEAAKARGFDQVLWLFGEDRQVTEAGASNFFTVWRSKEDGIVEIVTAGLEDKVILDGVTRRSLLELARERLGGELRVVERKFSMDEVLEASNEGRLLEMFAAGTAFFVTPVTRISYMDQEIRLPLDSPNGSKYTNMLKSWLRDIKYGNEPHEWAVLIPEN